MEIGIIKIIAYNWVHLLLPWCLLFYILFYISTILHELSHKKYAIKYGVKILKSKEEVKKEAPEDEISRFSFFRWGIKWRFFGGASIHLRDKDIIRLNKNQKTSLLLAGIKSDLVYMVLISTITIIFVLYNLLLNRGYYLTNLIKVVLLTLSSLIIKTYQNLFTRKSKKIGDLQKLIDLLN